MGLTKLVGGSTPPTLTPTPCPPPTPPPVSSHSDRIKKCSSKLLMVYQNEKTIGQIPYRSTRSESMNWEPWSLYREHSGPSPVWRPGLCQCIGCDRRTLAQSYQSPVSCPSSSSPDHIQRCCLVLNISRYKLAFCYVKMTTIVTE